MFKVTDGTTTLRENLGFINYVDCQLLTIPLTLDEHNKDYNGNVM